MPQGASSAPAVVLVAGSGANDRWEDIGQLAPFYDIAMDLASRGYAVLAYDKRSCSAAVHPLCSGRVFCGAVRTPGCVNLQNISLYDFAGDASAAVRFVTAQPGVAGTGATIIGHSQGCTVAPVAASTLPAIVDTVVLLMGDGVTAGVLMSDQMEVQMPLYIAAEKRWEAQPPSPTRTAALQQLKGMIEGANCTITYAVSQFNLIRDGKLKISQTDAVLCPMGIYWHGNSIVPAQYSCPAACGTGICAVGQNSDACLEKCRVGAELAVCQPMRFMGSWLEIGELSTRLKTWTSLHGRVLAINSWQDLLVVPSTFKPLHKLLQGLTNVDVTIKTFHNITHDLTPLNKAAFSPTIMAALDDFLPTAAA